MRIPHWPALVCGLLLAATFGAPAGAAPPKGAAPGKVSLARANDDSEDYDDLDDDEDNPSFAVPGGGYQPTMYTGQAPVNLPATMDPGPGPEFYDSGMVPPQAWPDQSPYSQYRLQETYNEGGLWNFNAEDDFNYKTVFSLDYLYGSSKKPGTNYIGSSTQRSASFLPGQPGTYPTSYTTNWIPNIHLDGLRASIGREKPDGSGVALSGFALFENSLDNYYTSYRATPGLDSTSTLRALWGIIVANPDGSTTVLPFDTAFYQKYTVGIYGADVDVWMTPFFQRESFKVKMVWGAKFLRVHEDFYLNAQDSGLGYTAGGGSGGGGGTGTDPTSITGPFDVLISTASGAAPLSPYSTYLASSTTNNLVGPALGVRYDLGGENFKIWGQTKVVVAANIQQQNITSNNWNALKGPDPANTPNVVAGPDLANATQAGVLTQTITTTHISPIFEQTFAGEFPGFQLIPIVRNWDVFKNAKMRIGWTYIYVNEVARAASDINYNIHGATINTNNRTSFGYNTVNFAVDWRF